MKENKKMLDARIYSVGKVDPTPQSFLLPQTAKEVWMVLVLHTERPCSAGPLLHEGGLADPSGGEAGLPD